MRQGRKYADNSIFLLFNILVILTDYFLYFTKNFLQICNFFHIVIIFNENNILINIKA